VALNSFNINSVKKNVIMNNWVTIEIINDTILCPSTLVQYIHSILFSVMSGVIIIYLLVKG